VRFLPAVCIMTHRITVLSDICLPNPWNQRPGQMLAKGQEDQLCVRSMSGILEGRFL